MVGGGWIKIYRSIQEHWLWDNPIYLKWWLDLLMMANHKENKILFNGELIVVGIGERITSEQKLSERWYVSRNTVRKFMNLLISDEMISVKKSRKSGTWYKINNYADYQNNSEEKKHQTEQLTYQLTEHEKDNQLNINKNDKNDKNDKKVVVVEEGAVLKLYESIFGMLNPIMIQNLDYWCKDLSSELVAEALTISAKSNARNFKYTETILREWANRGVKSLDDVEALNVERERKNEQRYNKKSNHPQQTKIQTNSEVSY